MRRDRDANDALREQELERLLSVEPSTGFEARVRARVATQRGRKEPFGVWTFCDTRVVIAATVALALLAVAAGLLTPTVPVRQSSRVASVSASTPLTPTPRAEKPQTPASSGAVTGVAARAERHEAPVAVLEPPPGNQLALGEVVVSPAEAEGMRFLIGAVRAGRFDAAQQVVVPSTPEAVEAQAAEIAVPDPIVITPLEIVPLLRATNGGQDEGEAE